jgi:hypothetical protein
MRQRAGGFQSGSRAPISVAVTAIQSPKSQAIVDPRLNSADLQTVSPWRSAQAGALQPVREGLFPTEPDRVSSIRDATLVIGARKCGQAGRREKKRRLPALGGALNAADDWIVKQALTDDKGMGWRRELPMTAWTRDYFTVMRLFN